MNMQHPVIKDVAITIALAIVAIVALSATGFVVGDPFSGDHGLSKQAREKEVALLEKREILSHLFMGSGDDATVSYAYVGEKLPEKFSPDEVLALRTPSSWTRQVGVAPDGKAIYTARVYASPQFVQRADGWHQVEHATVSAQSFQEYEHGTIFSQLFSQPAFALSTTQYSQNGDGFVDENDTVWATAHASSTGSLFQCQASLSAAPDYTGFTAYARSYHHTSAGKLDFATVGYCISRAFIPFDTGFIPSGSNISAATLNLYVSSTTDGRNDGTDYVTVVQSSQASWTSLIAGDFDQDGAVTSPTEGIATGERKDITSISRNAYLTFNLNATGIGWIKRLGEASSCGTTTSKIILQGDSSWQVPGDWTQNNNSIEVIGGGGGGGTGTIGGAQTGGSGGGGGGYSKATNVGLPAGQVVTISVGAGGGSDTAGGDTYVCNSTSNCSSISGSAVVAGAKGGGAGTAGGAGGAGGASASGVGTTKFSGGNGGASTGKGSGGGGGAAGPNGAGANGSGPSPTDPKGGGGGGGASGGSAATAGTGSTGGTGGNNFLGTGGGVANGGQGAGGGGGGGGNGTASTGGGGGGSDPENDWGIIRGITFGPSGGSAGGGASGDCSGLGYALSPTNFGGGAGGTAGCASGSAPAGGTAAQGIIVIQYGNMATGITCLGVREGHDTTNTTMTTDKDDSIGFSTSEASGTSQDPYLSITFTAPPSFWQFQDF